MEDLYEILEIPSESDESTIKAAYRRLALRCHPDRKSTPEATEQFRQIYQAYEILSDAEKKVNYDQSRRITQSSSHNADLLLLGEMFHDEEDESYEYTCRCGGSYVVYEENLDGSSEKSKETEMEMVELLIPCSNCSIKVRVKVK
jgi:curved DNA-binding protein CbpA